MEKVKKVCVTVLLVLASITACLWCSACGGSENNNQSPSVVGISVKAEISETYVGEFDYLRYSIVVAYDNGSTSNVPLKNEYISIDDQAKITTVGTHTLTVNYLEKTATFSVTLKNHELSGVEFNDKTVTYNGLPQTIEIENLPDGATVTYSPQSEYTEVGEYEITATITKEYYDDLTLTATLKITDIMRKVTFVQAGFADVVKEVADGDGLKTEDIPVPQEVNGYEVKWERSDFTKITSDLTVGIVKTPKTYTITYVLNGGTNHRDNPEEFTIESSTLSLYTPEKAIGATFAGWYTTEDFNDESKIVEIKSGSYDNLTLYAKWLDYRIENADGFSIDYNQQPALVSLTVPYTTVGIDFNSRFTVSKGCTWKLFSDFTGNYEYPLKAMDLVTGENKAYVIVFHPDGEHFTRYLLNTYRLDMKSYVFMNDLDVWNEGEIQERSELSAPESNPSKTGYDFSGWAIKDSIVDSIIEFPYAVYNDVVFKAVYTPIKYDIVYNLNGGTLDTQRLKYTIEESFVFDNPTRDYYDFSRWYDNAEFNGSPISEVYKGTYGKIILYAKWTPTVYDITYELNDGKNSDDNPDNYNVESEKINFAAPAKTGYTFVGWYMESTFKTQVSAIEKGSHGDVKLYAKWQENVNGLNFDGNGHTGGNTAPMQLKTGETTDLPQNGFVKAGYTFVGWSTTKNGYVRYNDKAEYVMGTNSEYILYAVWEANLNTLYFDGNGATGGKTSAMQINTDASETLNANGFTRNKYLFAGWSTTIGGEVEYLDNAYYTMGTDGEYTLYAVWTLNENEITFDGNGNTSGEMQNQTVYNNGNKTLIANAFAKTGYRFIGWAESASGNVKYTDGAEVTFVQIENYTLYVKWEANENTLKFDGNGATGGATAPMAIRSDETATLNKNGFVKAGYHFIGWTESANGDVRYTDGATYTMGLNSSYTLYAVWQENVNGLNFDGNGNTSGSMNAVALKTGEATVIPSNAFVKVGYTFKGWATSAIGEVMYTDGATYTMGTDSEYTLYAVWEANLNTLKFDGNGATGGSTEQMQIKTDAIATLNANAFTRTGYAFDGWSTTANGTAVYADGAQYTMGTDSEYTLYAVWILNENIIVFDGNGATSGSMDNVIVKRNSSTVLLNNAYAKIGYHFIGWAESSDGDVKYTDGATVDFQEEEVYTLYAIWVEGTEGLTYSLSNSKYTVTGYTGTDTIVVIPSTYNDYPVTSIGGSAFENCSSLTSITIPDNVTSIGNRAFVDCDSIENIYYKGDINDWVQIEGISYLMEYGKSSKNLYINGELLTEANITTATKINAYAFYKCSSLTSITIPDSVTSVGKYAFDYCSSLTIVTIGNSVTSIGDWAFYNCESLTSITISDSVTSIGSGAFRYCSGLTSVYYTGTIDQWVKINFSGDDSNPLYYANNLYVDNKLVTEANITTATKIYYYAFYNYSSLTSVTIGNSVTSIRGWAFSGCGKLTSVTISDGVTSIESHAFRNCSSLTEIEIPNSVTSIGRDAFYNCSSLTSVTIGNSVITIGTSAFSGCDNLVKVNYTGTIDQWVEINFGSNYSNPLCYAKNLYINNVLVEEVNISSSTKINAYAFINCCSLKSVAIGNSVTSVESYAFRNCSSLTEIKIPNSVTSIGDYVFSGCSLLPYNKYDNGVYLGNIDNPYWCLVDVESFNITSFIVNDNCKFIHSHAFLGCSKLTNITIGRSVTSIGSYAFSGCDSLTSVYYTGTIDQWVQISFSDNDSNPLYYAKILYIDNKLVTEANITTATKINAYAFSSCSSLTNVIIGESVMSIEYLAFSNCGSLTSVTIRNGITSIRDYAFSGCDSLTSVYYTGTEEDWNKIRINSYNDDLTSATRYYYSETEPALNFEGTVYDGNYWHYADDGITPVVWKKEN